MDTLITARRQYTKCMAEGERLRRQRTRDCPLSRASSAASRSLSDDTLESCARTQHRHVINNSQPRSPKAHRTAGMATGQHTQEHERTDRARRRRCNQSNLGGEQLRGALCALCQASVLPSLSPRLPQGGLQLVGVSRRRPRLLQMIRRVHTVNTLTSGDRSEQQGGK